MDIFCTRLNNRPRDAARIESPAIVIMRTVYKTSVKVEMIDKGWMPAPPRFRP